MSTTSNNVLVFAETALALSETFIADHIRSLVRHVPTFVALEKSSDAYADVPRRYLIDGRSNALDRLTFRLGLNDTLDRLITELRPKLIHAHYMAGGAFVLPYARRHNVPLVVTAHGYDVTRRLTNTSFTDLLLRYRRRQLQRHGRLTLPVSDYLRRCLLTQGFAGTSVKTHYLGTRIFDAEPADVATSAPMLVYAGRLVEKKGIDNVLAAFQLVRRERPDATLTVIGDGPLRGLVESAAAQGGITVLGAQPPSEVRRVMRQARLFTLPSRQAANGDSEGFGLVLVEAQAQGIPVVTSRETGTGEALLPDETGFAVDGQDPTELAEAYLKLLNDPHLAAAMGASAYQFVRSSFDLNRQTAMLESIYDDVAGGAIR